MGYSVRNLKNKDFWKCDILLTSAEIMRLPALFCLAILALILPFEGRAASPAANLQQALGTQQPLYAFPADEIIAAVKLCAARDPKHAGDYVALVLLSGRNDADAIAPSLAAAAIQGLGANPKNDEIAAIVRATVKNAPTEVLDIVTATVKASPRSAATAIVQAAVSSVPHPEEMVTMDMRRSAQKPAGSDKQLDNKEVADGKAIAPLEKQMTLAEAIVQAALDADPGLSADELTAAVDQGLPVPPSIVEAPGLPVPPIPPTTNIPGFNAPGPVSP